MYHLTQSKQGMSTRPGSRVNGILGWFCVDGAA
jgi:hypothetical protein